MNKKLSKSTLDLGKNDSTESSMGRRELNKKVDRLEQAEKQNLNTISQLRTSNDTLRAVNEAMRLELRLLRPKNALMKGLLSQSLDIMYCKVL